MKTDMKLILAAALVLSIIQIYAFPDPLNVWKPYFGKNIKKSEKVHKPNTQTVKSVLKDNNDDDDESLDDNSDDGEDDESIKDSDDEPSTEDSDESSEDSEDASTEDLDDESLDNDDYDDDEAENSNDDEDDDESITSIESHEEPKKKSKNTKGDDAKKKKTEKIEKDTKTSAKSKKKSAKPTKNTIKIQKKSEKKNDKTSKSKMKVNRKPTNPNQGPKGEKGDRGPKGKPGDGSSSNIPMQAALSTVLTDHFGPAKDTIVPFDLVLLDLGDNYDNDTGIFICTIPGTYVVSLYLMSHPGAKVNARIYINNRPIAALWADDNKNVGFYPSSSIQTVTRLEFGDQVYVMLVDGGYGESWVHANYNAFTVYLLYEDTFMKKRR